MKVANCLDNLWCDINIQRISNNHGLVAGDPTDNVVESSSRHIGKQSVCCEVEHSVCLLTGRVGDWQLGCSNHLSSFLAENWNVEPQQQLNMMIRTLNRLTKHSLVGKRIQKLRASVPRDIHKISSLVSIVIESALLMTDSQFVTVGEYLERILMTILVSHSEHRTRTRVIDVFM